ncbi:TrkH family potassium uptake protein [Ferrovibrio sp.]|uniref:TrkH family potassium uptake protein n=1 Tax=Ferrovibrio sp. TaxID=1917215 RepID=UPI0025BB4403|nr:TrkH family potassium uptake protein [Ferrovibrio sp.]MBX3454467.1 TrkH family potassium uptake protein [Ferrovibrio sp.]
MSSNAQSTGRQDRPSKETGINPAPILYFVSVVSCVLGGFMLLPVLVDLVDRHDDYLPLLVCAAGTIFVGSGVAIATHGRHLRISQNETLLLLPITWMVASLVCALPFMLAETKLSLTDAVFESVSGLTTTGSTVMSGLDNAPRGLLMWRFLTQWIGGFGVVTIAVLALPFLRIGGLQLFSLDLSPNSTKFVPRMTEVVGQIGMIYILLTILCAVCFWIAGMNAFDAIGHAMTALATGGYSSHDASLGFFDSAAIEWISVVFMALGAMPFGLYIVALYGRPDVLFRDQQVRLFLLIILMATLMFAAWRIAKADEHWLDALRQGAFVTVSTITTTGFTSHDFSFWGSFPEMLALLLMLVGGCTGSTVGGIKVFRLHTMMQLLRAQIHRQIYPHGTFRITFNGESIPDAVRAGVATYIFIYLIMLAALALAIAATGLSFTESLGAAATALGNNGPGLGSIYGPCCTFREAPDITKWLMSFGMLAGRLEILMLIIPLSRAFWRA